MRKLLWCLPLGAVFMAGCNFDAAHNREHRAKWREGLREFHDQFDRFIANPLTKDSF